MFFQLNISVSCVPGIEHAVLSDDVTAVPRFCSRSIYSQGIRLWMTFRLAWIPGESGNIVPIPYRADTIHGHSYKWCLYIFFADVLRHTRRSNVTVPRELWLHRNTYIEYNTLKKKERPRFEREDIRMNSGIFLLTTNKPPMRTNGSPPNM